jgi:hypothetical protein
MRKSLAMMALTLSIVTAALASEGSRQICRETGIVVSACCCEEQQGALVCALTGQPVATCCCVPEAR